MTTSGRGPGRSGVSDSDGGQGGSAKSLTELAEHLRIQVATIREETRRIREAMEILNNATAWSFERAERLRKDTEALRKILDAAAVGARTEGIERRCEPERRLGGDRRRPLSEDDVHHAAKDGAKDRRTMRDRRAMTDRRFAADGYWTDRCGGDQALRNVPNVVSLAAFKASRDDTPEADS